SSRRRHTRSKRDWSSDVCSSDLCQQCRGYEQILRPQRLPASRLHSAQSQSPTRGCAWLTAVIVVALPPPPFWQVAWVSSIAVVVSLIASPRTVRAPTMLNVVNLRCGRCFCAADASVSFVVCLRNSAAGYGRPTSPQSHSFVVQS